VIQYLLKNADFANLFRFVSPSFFRVVSPQILFKIATQMKSNQADQKAWAELFEFYTEKLFQAGLGVTIQSESEGGGSRVDLIAVKTNSGELGHLILELFFYQIFESENWVLDFRAEAFQSSEGQLKWVPKRYFFRVSPSFAEGIRGLYRGFYLGDEELFTRALKSLNMEPAGESLKAHFGQGDQSSVRFKLKVFQETFTQVFEVCAQSRTQVQGDFFVLGLMLLGLYESLESLDSPLNVRGAFESALRKASLK
jgi:hypothetical protein